MLHETCIKSCSNTDRSERSQKFEQWYTLHFHTKSNKMSESILESFSNDSQFEVYMGSNLPNTKPNEHNSEADQQPLNNSKKHSCQHTEYIVGKIEEFSMSVSNGVGAELDKYQDICQKQGLRIHDLEETIKSVKEARREMKRTLLTIVVVLVSIMLSVFLNKTDEASAQEKFLRQSLRHKGEMKGNKMKKISLNRYIINRRYIPYILLEKLEKLCEICGIRHIQNSMDCQIVCQEICKISGQTDTDQNVFLP